MLNLRPQCRGANLAAGGMETLHFHKTLYDYRGLFLSGQGGGRGADRTHQSLCMLSTQPAGLGWEGVDGDRL